MSAEGFPPWEGPHGKVALCQFRDNILVATDCPPEACANLINLICRILRGCWGLQVDCNCIAPGHTQCTRGCCSGVRKAVGVLLVLTPNTTGCAFVEPAALTPPVGPALGPTTDDTFLQLPRVPAFYPRRGTQKWPPVDHHLVRTNSECRCMDASRAAEWFQVERSDQSAVHRAYQTSPNAIAATVKCLYSVTRHMPARRCVVVSRVGAS